jgi:multimeric flavodoxin WrbA
LREEVKHAEGIILGTPEYHGGYSGVLKNALDLMGFEEFEGKMLGLVGVSGGAMGAFGAMNSLREVGRALHAWVVPDQASIPQAWQEFDETGKLGSKTGGARAASRTPGGALCVSAPLVPGKRIPAEVGKVARESRRRGPLDCQDMKQRALPR